jgi:hypothetical protein
VDSTMRIPPPPAHIHHTHRTQQNYTLRTNRYTFVNIQSRATHRTVIPKYITFASNHCKYLSIHGNPKGRFTPTNHNTRKHYILHPTSTPTKP